MHDCDVANESIYIATEDASISSDFHTKKPVYGRNDCSLNTVNCVIANLPWGKNAANYYGHNENIFKNIGRLLKKSREKHQLSSTAAAAFIVPAVGFETDCILSSEFCVHSIYALGATENVVLCGLT